MALTTSANTMPDALRIGVARAALQAASGVRGANPAIADDAVVDLLADLRHFCKARRIDFDTCNLIAQAHFETEINGGAQ